MTTTTKTLAAAAAVAVGAGVALVSLPTAPTYTLGASAPCALETSTNLVDWQPWTNGLTLTVSEPQRYFRGVITAIPLAWDASPGGVAGYRVYCGLVSHVYTRMVDAGTNCALSVPVLGNVTYYAATAYDAAGTESDFSNEICPPVPRPTLTLTRN